MKLLHFLYALLPFFAVTLYASGDLPELKIRNKTTKNLKIELSGARGRGTSINPVGRTFSNYTISQNREGVASIERVIEPNGTLTIIDILVPKEKVKIEEIEIPSSDLLGDELIVTEVMGALQFEPVGKQRAPKHEVEEAAQAATDLMKDIIRGEITTDAEVNKALGVAGIAHPTDYDVLGLPRSATKAEIRRKYQLLSLKWHPDKHESERQGYYNKIFQEITNAYDRLMAK